MPIIFCIVFKLSLIIFSLIPKQPNVSVFHSLLKLICVSFGLLSLLFKWQEIEQARRNSNSILFFLVIFICEFSKIGKCMLIFFVSTAIRVHLKIPVVATPPFENKRY